VRVVSACGPPLPTCEVHEVAGYLRYCGRARRATGTSVRDALQIRSDDQKRREENRQFTDWGGSFTDRVLDVDLCLIEARLTIDVRDSSYIALDPQKLSSTAGDKSG
jgi:hypothetical protein